MVIFAVGIEYPLGATVHRPQHPDAGMKQRAATFRSHHQRLYSGLPVWQLHTAANRWFALCIR
jgi:hypothetical protein